MTINTNYMDGFSHHLCQKPKAFNAEIIAPDVLFVNSLFKKVGDPYRIRTDVNGVRGRCLNHLTNGPLVHLHGLEPGTH